MATVDREVERTYVADDAFQLPPLTELVAGTELRPDPASPVAGGDDGGWHLEVPAGRDARSEVRLPSGRSTRTVPAPLLRMVWAQTLGSALRPVAEIVTDRTVRRLVDVTGHVVAEVADDRVTARRLLPTDGQGDAAGAATSWRAIEVELGTSGDDVLFELDARLRERGLSRAPSASELAR